MKYTHPCFGSQLVISTDETTDISDLIVSCFEMADEFERKYSRFISWNFLAHLNEIKKSVIDEEFYTLVDTCLKISKITDWYFDMTILPVLENLWYGVAEKKLDDDYGYKNIILGKDFIELKNNVSIELGAIGKGYMVDKIWKRLEPILENFVINFGWDIIVKGKEEIELEDVHDQTKMIGVITVKDSAIASSAGNKRVFEESHHLINPETKQSQNDKKAIYVTHKYASFADVFSTALFVTPLKKALKIIAETEWLEALIVGNDGKMYKSRWCNVVFNT